MMILLFFLDLFVLLFLLQLMENKEQDLTFEIEHKIQAEDKSLMSGCLCIVSL